MGRIKSTLVKRTSRKLVGAVPESFSPDFEANKKSLGKNLPSKKIRNKVAGYISRIKANTKNLIEEKSE